MGRSNNTELVNPAKKFFKWAGGTGDVVYFDKTLGEKGENVTVTLPFKFLVLEKTAQVTGGVDRNGIYNGFWSNMVMNTKTQPFTVRSKAGIEVQGLWEHVKGFTGAKFAIGLYIAFLDEDERLELGHLEIKGAALTAWIEFCKTHKDIYAGAFAITGKTKQKKGSTTYFEPVFKHFPKVSDEADATAMQMHKDLLADYLKPYFAQAEQMFAAHAVGAASPSYTGGNFYDNEPEMAPDHGDAWEPDESTLTEVPF